MTKPTSEVEPVRKDRHSGTGRSINEPPKKNGMGPHNWVGSMGDETDPAYAPAVLDQKDPNCPN
ncbi:hypothetical protein CAOG_00310 [Capsaspora owczarzaki ATCC 30864]|uniref:Hyaluronan/mRNA-binding protein domain-containing protein n=1 Tax=Capsaspora owczarzaki (strain ATCC 30864) TaxID=595528 RepID=A0A0D2WGV8_CAPO3|nr:hypothetical protein CAOG_00310 [Capsaspora owczarzaki ATCC 30864]KJE88715.1 hypothetical protein CAOG_000310 [Capsaspora owczarzaki ATCC 30864]|eukprot:XP_004365181.1 hypothetical protein CAOG_00310 [Capsaspora owczarzaki ATCC 30864]